jgi:uncharacterized spore protein YtfJ
MDQNTAFSQNVDTLFSDLRDFVNSESVLGTPVSVADKTLVPVISVTLGYGSTPGMGKKQGDTQGVGGIGLGARVSTDGVIVIDKDNISMLSSNKGAMQQLVDKIPQMLGNMGGQQGAAQGQQQNPIQGILQNMMPNQQQGQDNSQQQSQDTTQQI